MCANPSLIKCERGRRAAIHRESRFQAPSLPPIPPGFGSMQDAREAGEDDIEAILAEILNKEAKKTAVCVFEAHGRDGIVVPPYCARFVVDESMSDDEQLVVNRLACSLEGSQLLTK